MNANVGDDGGEPPQQQVVLGLEQVERILRGCRPGRKPDSFSSGDPVEWRTWRANFEIITEINQWNNARARREAAACMTGLAKIYVQDIPHGAEVGPPVPGFGLLLDSYQERFMPQADSDLARISLKEARQGEDETVLAWHSNVRHLYQRAHPNVALAALGVERNLMDAFILGIRDPSIRADVWKARPANYTACLDTAQNLVAGAQVLKSRASEDSKAGGSGAGLFAMADTRTCFVCEKPGHVYRDCYMYKRSKEKAGRGGRYSSRGRGSGKPHGGGWKNKTARGRGSYRGSSSRGNGSFRGSSSYNKSWTREKPKVSQVGEEEYGEVHEGGPGTSHSLGNQGN